ncbi:MAG: tetratricopeptide repeat protein [Spirochaetales bacterium]|nr:tetratricopeptide repeat protein [Spirochaetales bacterium]
MNASVKELREKGKILLAEKKYDEAMEVYWKWIELDDQAVHPRDVLGFLYYITGSFEEAREQCLAALTLRPGHYYALKGLGLCLVRLGQVEEGIETIKKSIKANPGYFDSRYDLAVTYLELERYDEAREAFLQAGEIDSSRKIDIDKALAYLEQKQQ